MYHKLGKPSETLLYFFKAYAIRPHRIESLIYIAQHFLDVHDYCTAFILAKYATTFSVPSQEKLLIVPQFYYFARYDILAIAAWHVGEYEIGRQATLKALEYDPDNIGLRKTLLLYEDALNHRDCNHLNRSFWCKWCSGNFWQTRPEWFNLSCLANGCYRSNRCNISNGIAWRYWVGPFNLDVSLT
jgi:hypothetical protein